MLRELADNSINDKIELKKALKAISHQLKTPLTSIIILLDNILDNPNMDAKTKEDFIINIKRETLNINFLVQTMLKLSKFDVNVIHFDNKKNNLNEIIDESIKNVSSICDLKNIKIDFFKKENIFIYNAVEHAYFKSIIKINIENNKIYSKVSITNNGVGIDKKDLKHIFKRFYKGDNSSKDSIGIGLSLSKKIIGKNNGMISVKSKKNKETIFEIKYFN